jgi:undecaprenyl-diphosphatase
MSIVQAVFLGFIQGITEFLPVSSSGHLVLVQKIIGISGPSMFFDTLLHCGTLLSVIVALRADVWNLLRRPFQRISIFLIIATAVTVAAVIAFKDRIEEAFESGQWLGQAFLITSLAIFISEYLSRRPTSFRNDAEMDLFDAVLIGFLQGIAVAPGVSRSGLTLSGALSRKLNRDLAVRFSFLLAIPAILGALILQLWELYKISHFPSVNPAASEGFIAAGMAIPFAAGTLMAALVGFVAVVIMLRIVRKHSLVGFGVYTTLLGLLILLDQNIFHIVF